VEDLDPCSGDWGAGKMSWTEKPVQLARRGRRAVPIIALSLSTLLQGCSAQFEALRGPAQVEQQALPGPLAGTAIGSNHATSTIRLDVDQERELPTPREQPPESNNEKKEPDDQKDKGGSTQPKLKITLPMAIQMCVNNNFRVLAEAQKVKMAEGDLITSSLIPNPSLFADYQLIPLQHVDPQNQLGPPQWDTLVSFPIDWLLFGKRVAAVQASRLGVEAKSANFANVLRAQLAQTIDKFYEVLMDDAYLKLAEKNVEELTELEKLTEELVKAKKVGKAEVDRIKLAVYEAVLERHDRELALDIARARLRPFIGRTAADPDYEVEGKLKVKAVVPPPKLEEAVALAEAHRPDLISGRKEIEQAKAVEELEYRRGKPQVSIQPGWTYQNQRYVNGFRNGSMLDIGISTTLPITDCNQGNIRKAKAAVEERQFSYQGDRADVLAEVESSVATYVDAVEHLTQFNTPETLKAAHDLRRNVEADYRAGNRKLIELLDAQKAYQSRLAHIIESESTYWRALNSLNATVGLKAYDQERAATQPLGKGAEKQK
jgi:cobalt-zinc-cadmium efflux system outer membrane protein